MTRTDTGLTATTDERRRFRLLMRLAKAGQSGQTPRSLIRAGGSIERPAFTAELERLTEARIIEPIVDGVERYRLTPTALASLGFLFPEAMYGTPPVETTLRPPSEFVWQPDPESLRDPEADVDPSPQPPGDYFWTDPEPVPPGGGVSVGAGVTSPAQTFWDTAADGVMTVEQARESAGFWS